MADALRLCKDCKHVLPALNGKLDEHARCALVPVKVSLVTGETEGDNFAAVMRLGPSKCGPTGKLWEAK